MKEIIYVNDYCFYGVFEIVDGDILITVRAYSDEHRYLADLATLRFMSDKLSHFKVERVKDNIREDYACVDINLYREVCSAGTPVTYIFKQAE